MEHRTETAGASTALSFVHTTTALTRELTNMMQISAAGAAASILLMIFETLEVRAFTRTMTKNFRADMFF